MLELSKLRAKGGVGFICTCIETLNQMENKKIIEVVYLVDVQNLVNF